MISRIMLSLKKAADLTRGGWSITQGTVDDSTFRSTLRFNVPPRRGPVGKEDVAIPLDTFHEP